MNTINKYQATRMSRLPLINWLEKVKNYDSKVSKTVANSSSLYSSRFFFETHSFSTILVYSTAYRSGCASAFFSKLGPVSLHQQSTFKRYWSWLVIFHWVFPKRIWFKQLLWLISLCHLFLFGKHTRYQHNGDGHTSSQQWTRRLWNVSIVSIKSSTWWCKIFLSSASIWTGKCAYSSKQTKISTAAAKSFWPWWRGRRRQWRYGRRRWRQPTQ